MRSEGIIFEDNHYRKWEWKILSFSTEFIRCFNEHKAFIFQLRMKTSQSLIKFIDQKPRLVIVFLGKNWIFSWEGSFRPVCKMRFKTKRIELKFAGYIQKIPFEKYNITKDQIENALFYSCKKPYFTLYYRFFESLDAKELIRYYNYEFEYPVRVNKNYQILL